MFFISVCNNSLETRMLGKKILHQFAKFMFCFLKMRFVVPQGIIGLEGDYFMGGIVDVFIMRFLIPPLPDPVFVQHGESILEVKFIFVNHLLDNFSWFICFIFIQP